MESLPKTTIVKADGPEQERDDENRKKQDNDCFSRVLRSLDPAGTKLYNIINGKAQGAVQCNPRFKYIKPLCTALLILSGLGLAAQFGMIATDRYTSWRLFSTGFGIPVGVAGIYLASAQVEISELHVVFFALSVLDALVSLETIHVAIDVCVGVFDIQPDSVQTFYGLLIMILGIASMSIGAILAVIVYPDLKLKYRTKKEALITSDHLQAETEANNEEQPCAKP